MNPENYLPDNILEQTPPTTKYFIQRVKFCAKALAYGAANDKWAPRFSVITNPRGEQLWGIIGHINYGSKLKTYLTEMWGNEQPQMYFLEAFGYVRHVEDIQRKDQYGNNELFSQTFILTPKAF